MVITKPLKLLVCLAVLLAFIPRQKSFPYTPPDITEVPGIQGDALSASPKPGVTSSQHRGRSRSTDSVSFNRSMSEHTHKSSHRSRYSSTYRDPGSVILPPRYPAVTPSYSMPVPARQAYCPPPQICSPPAQACSPFGQCFPFGFCNGFMPRINSKRFEIGARLWYATLNNSKIIWGTQPGGMPGTELDLHDDLGLCKHQYLGEYEARCQIRCKWGLHFSFMPIVFRDNFTPTNFFYFGNAFYAPAISSLTEWNRYIYRADLVYDWFRQPHAVSSIFAGYALYDDKLTVSQNFTSRSRSTGFGLAYAGINIDRLIKNFGCSGATASLHCKWSVQFLEGYFGWDGYAAGRIAVPMQNGRFGYVEAGWRWIVLERDYPSNADKTNLDGLIGAVGLIF
jgi:hypothetical protein